MYEDLCLCIGGEFIRDGGRREQVSVRDLRQTNGSTQTVLRKRPVVRAPGLRGYVLHATSGTGLVQSMLGKSLIPIEADNEGEAGDPRPANPDSRSAGHPRYGLSSQRVAISGHTVESVGVHPSWKHEDSTTSPKLCVVQTDRKSNRVRCRFPGSFRWRTLIPGRSAALQAAYFRESAHLAVERKRGEF